METESGVNVEEFASILISFLENTIVPLITNSDNNIIIIIYNDGYSYQNRNCIMVNALLNLVMSCNITILQIFLDHTQIEVDSVHRVIQQKIMDKIINVPPDYITVCRQARFDVTFSRISMRFSSIKTFDEDGANEMQKLPRFAPCDIFTIG